MSETDTYDADDAADDGTFAKWAPVANILLGLWLAIVPTFVLGAVGLRFWSDLIVGLVVAGLATYGAWVATQSDHTSLWGPGLNALLGLWVIATPFLFEPLTDALFWNDVIVGLLIVLVAAIALFGAGTSDRVGARA
ncbi:MAG: SPW repeat protein [Haloarculaceae archaeon]